MWRRSANDIGVPKPYPKVTAPAHEISTIRRKCNTGDIVGVVERGTGDLTRFKVPDLHDDVRASGSKEDAIGRYGDGGDDICMGFHRFTDLFSGDDIPDTYCAIVGCGDKLTTVWSVHDASHIVLVAFHRTEQHLTNVRITDANSFVVCNAGDLETIRGISEGIQIAIV